MRHLISLAFAAALVAGCANQPGTQNTDKAFGQAVGAAKALQVVDPAAPSRVRPEMGSDGEQARTAVDQYEKANARPAAPAAVLNIGIGGSSGGGASR